MSSPADSVRDPAVVGASDEAPIEVAWRNPAAIVWHMGALGLFSAALFGAVVVTALGMRDSSVGSIIYQGLFPSAALSAVCSLARRLSAQKALMVGLGAGGLALVAMAISTSSGVPFGQIEYSSRLGFKLLREVPWPMPFLWIAVIIICRGMARLMLRPYRKTTHYGFAVLGVASLLAVLLDLALEPFAVRHGEWWKWNSGVRAWTWYGAPWANSLGWFVTHALVLAFVTPWLLNKQPVRQPIDLHPLGMWCALLAFLAFGNLVAGLWVPAFVSLAGGGAVAFAAWRTGASEGSSMLS